MTGASVGRADPRTGRARALRRTATPAERKLWRQLNQLEFPIGHFRRQAPIGPYFADFAHHGLQLVVELDGAQHGLTKERRRDAKRDAYLEAAGYRVLRFWNNEVFDSLEGVVETILAAAADRPPTPVRGSAATRPSPPQAGGGERVALSDNLARLLKSGEPTILVAIADAQGSTPREAGAAMLVTTGESHGTIGGGQLEYHAIDTARVMLARGEGSRELDLPLGPLLGQCCGGRVRVKLERAGAEHVGRLAAQEQAARRRARAVLVFGCGHTGRALASALAPLPYRTSVIDDRLDAATDLPNSLTLLRLDDPAEAVAAAPPGAAYVILTHSHALDYRLADAALRREDAAYVGMIGSATKRARFERFFLQGGGRADLLGRLTCPIGGAQVPDKRPEIIAALTAAELIRVFAQRGSGEAEVAGEEPQQAVA